MKCLICTFIGPVDDPYRESFESFNIDGNLIATSYHNRGQSILTKRVLYICPKCGSPRFYVNAMHDEPEGC